MIVPPGLRPGPIFASLPVVTAARIYLALSAEEEADFEMVQRAIIENTAFAGTIANESLLDLFLRTQTIQPGRIAVPDLIIAYYGRLFTDLKIVAELRKLPEFQWTPIYVIVNEDITNTRTRFLQVGISGVIPFYHGSDLRMIVDDIIEHFLALSKLPAGARSTSKPLTHEKQTST